MPGSARSSPAGYDAVIVANHHTGAQGGAPPNAFLCGSQGSEVLGTAAGMCVGHRFMHLAFGRAPDYTLPYPLADPGDLEPNVGDLGPDILSTSQFDGWGCVRLLDAVATTEIDEYCLDEELDSAFNSGFGILTLHEVEVPLGEPNEGATTADDDSGLAYFSWYSGGFRVAKFEDTGIHEVGAFIDQGGNDFWGVALAEDETATGSCWPAIETAASTSSGSPARPVTVVGPG
jgi:hypothetical protein